MNNLVISRSRHVMVAPLDWGLGHATRCIPIIKELLNRKISVIIAGSHYSLKWLTQYFPTLPYCELPSHSITYGKGSSQFFPMLFQFPQLLQTIKLEHKALEQIIQNYSIQVIISDHRYGLHHPSILSIFVAHQLNIQLPFQQAYLQKLAYISHLNILKPFNAIWIPDFPHAPFLSGDLSHQFPLPKKARFIGPLSRFENKYSTSTISHKWEKVELGIILSGPEPHRSIIEAKLIRQVNQLGLRTILVQGKLSEKKMIIDGSVQIYSSLDSEKLGALLISSNIIISRPGYTSIMDYVSLKLKSIIFVPTPGQTEQEYLAKYFYEQGVALFQTQENLDISLAIEQIESFSGFENWATSVSSEKLREEAMDQFFPRQEK